MKKHISKHTDTLFELMRSQKIEWLVCNALINLRDEFPEF